MSELRNLPPAQRTRIVQLQRQVLLAMQRSVARAAPAIATADLGAVTMLVMGMVNWLHTWYREDGPVTHDHLESLVARMVGGALQGVAAAKEPVLNNGRRFNMPRSECILDAALSQGIALPHQCRGASCGMCKARVTQGTVDNGWSLGLAISDQEIAEGFCLMCQARPLSAE
eukprot:gene14996-19163_t